MRLIGIILLVLGGLALVYQGFTFVTKEKVVDVGPVEVTADRKETVWIPPVVAGIAAVSGLVLLAAASGRKD
jgi:hypothetical protein